MCVCGCFRSTRVGSVTRVLMVQIQRFSESLEGAHSDDILKSGMVLFSGKDHGPMVFCQKHPFYFNTSSERPLSKLSENHKINVIGPTELKLWPFKDALFNTRSPSFCVCVPACIYCVFVSNFLNLLFDAKWENRVLNDMLLSYTV